MTCTVCHSDIRNTHKTMIVGCAHNIHNNGAGRNRSQWWQGRQDNKRLLVSWFSATLVLSFATLHTLDPVLTGVAAYREGTPFDILHSHLPQRWRPGLRPECSVPGLLQAAFPIGFWAPYLQLWREAVLEARSFWDCNQPDFGLLSTPVW